MDAVEGDDPLPLPVAQVEAVVTADKEAARQYPGSGALVAAGTDGGFAGFWALDHVGILAYWWERDTFWAEPAGDCILRQAQDERIHRMNEL